MHYTKIPFETVKATIAGLFPTATLDNWNLVPDDLHKLAESAGIELQWKYSFSRIEYHSKWTQ